MSGVPEGNLTGDEDGVRSQIATAHVADLQVVYDLFSCVERGFQALGAFTKTPDKRLELARLLLVTRSFNSLRCAIWCTESGYYSQALALVRSVMEDHVTALDCDSQEETLAALLDGKGELGRGSLAFADMARRVSPTFENSWKYNYGKLSEYAAHPRRAAITHLLEPGTQVLRLGAYYDADFVVGTVDAVLHGLIGVAELLPKVLGDRAEAWQEECIGPLRAASEWKTNLRATIESDESGGGEGRA